MAQITSGIRSILSNPFFYDFFQTVLGAEKFRKDFVKYTIRPKPKMKILDIGCGTGRILNYLPSDIEYVGYDPSKEYIDYAQKSYPNRGNFVAGYFDRQEANKYERFDVILCLGVLHHLDDTEVSELLELFRDILSESGRFCSVDGTFINGQNKLAKFIIEQDRGRNVRFYDEYIALAKRFFSNVQPELKHRKFIPYTYCFMECSLKN